MNIIFDDETINARELETWPGRLRIGDYLQTNSGLVKIVTVQPACPYLENIHHYFTQTVAVNEWGDVLTFRFEGTNKIAIFRRRRR